MVDVKQMAAEARAATTFDSAHQAEIDWINTRRAKLRQDGFQVPPAGGAEPRLTGLALSGGGVRSAAFCLGAVQGLAARSEFLVRRIDYLSTVSGGGFIGAALTLGLEKSQGRFPLPSELGASENPDLQRIRDFSSYLVTGRVANLVRAIGSVAIGFAAGVVTCMPFIFLGAALTVALHPTRRSLQRPSPLFAAFDFLGLGGNFAFTVYALVLSALLMLVCLGLSSIEGVRRTLAERDQGRLVLGGIAIFPFVIAFAELQPFLIRLLDSGPLDISKIWPLLVTISATVTTLAPIVGRFFRASEAKAHQRRWQALAASALRWLAYTLLSLFVPILLWFTYLLVAYWGIATSGNTCSYAAPALISTIFCSVGSLTGGLNPVVILYVIGALLMLALWAPLRINIHSLHPFYRDRIANAFLNPASETPIDLRLSQRDPNYAPYNLINAAIAIYGSPTTNARGRNADFFTMGPRYCGSSVTGYCKTDALETACDAGATAGAEPVFDIGTAVAVSGAAVSPNIGGNVFLRFSLTMLNLRLGYWLPNPTAIREGRPVPMRWAPRWTLQEAFSRLRSTSDNVYLTDGGHIDNLGLYELLRRRCSTIIVVDAEADPTMKLPSFSQVQRYARIDLGIRIDIELDLVAKCTLARNADRYEAGPHCAIGIIHYDGNEDGPKGLLVYIKSSITGDEADYVRTYAAENADFPHETTIDQFFSESQFEAYRALGFHAAFGMMGEHTVQIPSFGQEKVREVANRGLAELGITRPIRAVWRTQ